MKKSKYIRPIIMALPTAIFALPLISLFITSLEKKGIGNYIYVLTAFGLASFYCAQPCRLAPVPKPHRREASGPLQYLG